MAATSDLLIGRRRRTRNAAAAVIFRDERVRADDRSRREGTGFAVRVRKRNR